MRFETEVGGRTIDKSSHSILPWESCARAAAAADGIRNGQPLNEGKRVAESTMTAIMGRMSAYTGRALKWDWVMNASKLYLTPQKYEFGDLPVSPVAVPGETKLV